MDLLGTIGYGTAALAFAGLTGVLAVGWQGRGQGVRLIVATGVTALWAGTLAWLATAQAAPPGLLFLADTLRSAAWLVALGGLVETGGFPQLVRRVAWLTWLSVLAAGIASALFAPWLFTSVALGGGLLLAVTGLVLLEQIYRNTNPSGRWTLRYLYIGVGALFVYDLFLYSQALLFSAMSLDAWQARGFIAAMAVPFIAIAARRNPSWSLNVFVSRDVVFYTTSFLGVGGYLLLMAAGGYLVRWIGGEWGGVAQIVFFTGAALLLLVMIASTDVRRRVKVFLVKHFYRNKYEYREEWLRFIDTLSAAEDGDVRVTSARAVAQIIQSPAAALFVAPEPGKPFELVAQWPEGWLPQQAGSLGHETALSDFLAQRGWVVDLQEYRGDPGMYDNLALPAWLVERQDWRLIVPVMLGERLFGCLLLRQPPQGFELTFEDRDLLKTVARHIATHVAQQDSERRLAESRQFEAYSRLTAFLMHDLKNAAAQLQLVVANAEKHKRNPEFVDDAIETIQGSAARITRLIGQLQKGDAPGGLEALESITLCSMLEGITQRLSQREPRPQLADCELGLTVRANAEKLTSAIEHALRNAQDATPPGGEVVVSAARRSAQTVAISIRDTGSGMDPEFLRERLFRPFDSTKGSKGMGIGAYQVREYARELGGDVEVESTPGKGTTFTIVLPTAQ